MAEYDNTISIEQCKQLLNLYNIEIPHKLHDIKLKTNKVMVSNFCKTNQQSHCQDSKKLLILLNKHRLCSINNKQLINTTRKNGFTKKIRLSNKNNTKCMSPIQLLYT